MTSRVHILGGNFPSSYELAGSAESPCTRLCELIDESENTQETAVVTVGRGNRLIVGG